MKKDCLTGLLSRLKENNYIKGLTLFLEHCAQEMENKFYLGVSEFGIGTSYGISEEESGLLMANVNSNNGFTRLYLGQW